jgi:aromatic-amino-acid transaminase
VLRERELLPYLDLAYQGYGDGIEEDAYAVRALAASGLPFFVANSFSKSMSVYGERAGALSVVCADAAEADRCWASSRPPCGATTPAPASTPPASWPAC